MVEGILGNQRKMGSWWPCLFEYVLEKPLKQLLHKWGNQKVRRRKGLSNLTTANMCKAGTSQ